MLLTVFNIPYFHTLFWLYFLFPITWILATISNLIASFIIVPKDLKNVNALAEAKDDIQEIFE